MKYILELIKQRGRQNADAIKAHHDHQAGINGAFANIGRKSGLQGLACPKRKKIKAAEVRPLPNFKVRGTPIVTDGTKGYKRDRITGVITKCVETEAAQ